ncbi:MAG: A/G-specific adenine glycosylase [Bacillus thermozeamaize]|uniref:Adenine DNA glycosylase n=1 Tax=Bacillus thermozeamaize TaxID=230954 RepID=A0A1Y3PFD8_9BACI|nr:MAG: A/G-specific adenine glycosylase [Bacillus thermozeamaize]
MISIQLQPEYVEQLQAELLAWFRRRHRNLPWRRERDPYRIWVSEVMLQQTRVDTVIPYYERFIRLFPTLEDLARADEAEVLKAWEGLGYYSRARNLLQGVREVCERYGGQVPDTIEEMLSIKGIGPYTAGAILSIAYGKPVPAVDGNVMRVISRLFSIQEDIAKASTRKRIEELVQRLIPPDASSHFNQGLMELGALVCLPRSPACEDCPLQALCQAYRDGNQETLPVKAQKKPPRPVGLAAAVLWWDGKVLIRRRPHEGLLAGLWEFPNVVWEASFDRWRNMSRDEKVFWLIGRLEAIYPFRFEKPRYLMPVRHVFSHIKWDGAVFELAVTPLAEWQCQDERWVSVEELSRHAFPVPYGKVVRTIQRTQPRKS